MAQDSATQSQRQTRLILLLKLFIVLIRTRSKFQVPIVSFLSRFFDRKNCQKVVPFVIICVTFRRTRPLGTLDFEEQVRLGPRLFLIEKFAACELEKIGVSTKEIIVSLSACLLCRGQHS